MTQTDTNSTLTAHDRATAPARVHLDGYPYLTGTIIEGDLWCNRVTVAFDEGRTLLVSTARLAHLPHPYSCATCGVWIPDANESTAHAASCAADQNR